MQPKVIKFIALLFIGLVLCTITVSGQFGFGRRDGCECTGRRRWTRNCCYDTQGFFRHGICQPRFTNEFLRCCRFFRQDGVCFNK